MILFEKVRNLVLKKRWVILAHPILLAFYFWIILIFLIPDFFQKYDVEIIKKIKLSESKHVYYTDLNNDGISEMVSCGYNGGINNQIRIQHFNLNDLIYGHWLLKGEWLKQYKPLFADYNNNDFQEVYCFTIVKDSIFLNSKELMKSDGLHFENRFVCIAGQGKDGRYDVKGTFLDMQDIDGDGFKEVIFVLHAGYSRYPRGLFIYNIIKDSLMQTPVSASFPNLRFSKMDINGDGINEITGLVGSPENIHYPCPYTDSSAWLMVVNPKTLDFEFEPIQYKMGIGSFVESKFVEIRNKKYVVVITHLKTAGKKNDSIQDLYLYDTKGELVKSMKFDDVNKNLFFIDAPKNGPGLNVLDNYNTIYKLNNELEFEEYSHIDFIDNVRYSGKLNADNIGLDEHLFISGDEMERYELLIGNNNFSHFSKVYLGEISYELVYSMGLINYGTKKKPLLWLQIGDNGYKIKYSENKYYILKYPFYLILYLLLLFIFWLLNKVQTQFAKQKFEEEKELLQQQIALSKKTLEPHFMLNTLNNIGQMFNSEKKEDAQYYFGKFSSLIHRGLEYADKTETTLLEELEFVRDYLLLQKSRFRDFEYEIIVDEEIEADSILIPHSLVYTFVENALKHGLRPKTGDKNIWVNVELISGTIKITVRDNGIGRHKSKEINTHGTGKGLAVIKDIVFAYNKLNKRNIQFEIRDLNEGVEVEILV